MEDLLTLPTIDFLREITIQSLKFYKDGETDSEENKAVIEFPDDKDFLNALLQKFESAKEDLQGNEVLTGYINYRCAQILKLLSEQETANSVYNRYPQYGVQYFKLIAEILIDKSDKKKKSKNSKNYKQINL